MHETDCVNTPSPLLPQNSVQRGGGVYFWELGYLYSGVVEELQTLVKTSSACCYKLGLPLKLHSKLYSVRRESKS